MSRPPGLVSGWIWFETTAIFRNPFLALLIGKPSNFSCFLAFFLSFFLGLLIGNFCCDILFVLSPWAALLQTSGGFVDDVDQVKTPSHVRIIYH